MPDEQTLPNPLRLPFEYRFDVPTAKESVAQLAGSEPDATIVLTVAQVTADGGIEEEQEVQMRAEEVAALLSTVGADQRIAGLSRELYLLRVTRPTT